MNEAETRADHIDPALTAAGWGVVVGVSLAPTLVRPLRAPLPSASRSRGVAPGSAWLAPFGAPASSARLGLCSGRRVPPPPTSRLGSWCGRRDSSVPTARHGLHRRCRNSSAPKAHPNFSPGQRPGYPTPQKTQALKGRPKNPAPASDVSPFPPPTLGRPFGASSPEPSGFAAPKARLNFSPGQPPNAPKSPSPERAPQKSRPRIGFPTANFGTPLRGFNLGTVRFPRANGAPQSQPRATPWVPERALQPMPQSLARLHIHLIFSTKNREPVLLDSVRDSLHRYMATVLQNLGCPPELINSVPDHVHILFELGRTVAVSNAVEQVKKTSSKWVKTQGSEFTRFAWQAGYGAFAVSQSNVTTVRQYIAGQQQHHRKKSFQEEYRAFLERHNVPFDEKYVWD